MKFMFSLTVVATALLLACVVTGCASSRDAFTQEYNRLASMTPEPPVRCPQDKAIDDLGVGVGVNYAIAHKWMKEFVDATTNSREFIAFMNDVNYYMEEEKLDHKAAVEKVYKEILAADEKIADPKEKVWPRVAAGINAVNSLMNVKAKQAEIKAVIAATKKTIAGAQKLKDSFKGFDADTIAKGLACVQITKQATATFECLVFLSVQFENTRAATFYAK